MDTCELREFAILHKWGKCSQDITFEHILAKQLFRNNKAGLKLAYDTYGDFFGATTCLNHNAGNKCADTTEAVLFLMRKRLREHPEVFPLMIEEVAATFKGIGGIPDPPSYLRMEYLMET